MTHSSPTTPLGWAGLVISRTITYALLLGFAWLMLFPFIYMLSTSLKTSGDVFRVPPRLLPYAPRTIEIDGQQVATYQLEADGRTRTMLLTGERARFGFFADADGLNAASPRDSVLAAQAPLDATTPTGARITLGGSDYDVYSVPLPDGTTQELLLAYRGALDTFVDIDDPSVFAYAVARTAPLDEDITFQWGNYATVFGLNLDRALVNTTIVTLGVVAGQLVTSVFGGYAFSRLRFRGRDTLFVVYLGSLMIPFVVLIIPMYRLMVLLGWQNQLVSLIVPWIFSAYGTFLMRQAFLVIPKDLEEAALMDGASRLRILWQIFVPLVTPSLATLAVFSFLYAWNSFLWPLLIIGEGNERNHVLTLSLIRLSNAAAERPNLVLTGAAVAVLPPIVLFVLAQRYFVAGIATSGLKG